MFLGIRFNPEVLHIFLKDASLFPCNQKILLLSKAVFCITNAFNDDYFIWGLKSNNWQNNFCHLASLHIKMMHVLILPLLKVCCWWNPQFQQCLKTDTALFLLASKKKKKGTTTCSLFCRMASHFGEWPHRQLIILIQPWDFGCLDISVCLFVFLN